MARIPQNMMPPQRRANAENAQNMREQSHGDASNAANTSPAYIMAKRIRSEQGQERAKQYLYAMEPYLAPAERAFIAEQLGISLAERNAAQPPPPQYQQSANQGYAPPYQPQYQPPMQPQYQQPPVQNAANLGNMMQMAQMAQMMGMLQGMGNKGAAAPSGGGMGDQMALMQTLMGMMGKK